MLKPKVSSQLMSQSGLGRPGGMASSMAPKIGGSKGSRFAAMENALLKKGVKTPKQAKRVAAPNSPMRQFNTLMGGGEIAGTKPFSNSTPSSNPTALMGLPGRQYKGKLGM